LRSIGRRTAPSDRGPGSDQFRAQQRPRTAATASAAVSDRSTCAPNATWSGNRAALVVGPPTFGNDEDPLVPRWAETRHALRAPPPAVRGGRERGRGDTSREEARRLCIDASRATRTEADGLELGIVLCPIATTDRVATNGTMRSTPRLGELLHDEIGRPLLPSAKPTVNGGEGATVRTIQRPTGSTKSPSRHGRNHPRTSGKGERVISPDAQDPGEVVAVVGRERGVSRVVDERVRPASHRDLGDDHLCGLLERRADLGNSPLSAARPHRPRSSANVAERSGRREPVRVDHGWTSRSTRTDPRSGRRRVRGVGRRVPSGCRQPHEVLAPSRCRTRWAHRARPGPSRGAVVGQVVAVAGEAALGRDPQVDVEVARSRHPSGPTRA